MSAPRQLKNEILDLRIEGKTYREIQKLLSCSRGTINYHCKRNELTDTGMKLHKITKEQKIAIAEYCKTHTSKQGTVRFGLGLSTIKAYRKYQSLD